MAADKYRCKKCMKNVAASGTVATQLRYRKHNAEQGEECPNSRTLIPMWIIQRGPETGEDDRPVIGRDYGRCPDCGRSPLLDGEGMYAEHLVKADVPAAEQVVCDRSGQPYKSGEEECPTASSTQESPGSASAADSASSSSFPSPSPSPNESEELIAKWAATAREIENRELPPPSPESTTTPTGSPPQHPCHISGPHPPHKWMHQRRQAQCPGKPVPAESASTEPAGTTRPVEAAAPASDSVSPTMIGSTQTPRPGKPAPTTAPTESAPAPSSAEDAAAASRAAPSSTASKKKPTDDGPPPDIAALAAVFPAAAAPSSARAAEPSTAATPPTPAAALLSNSPFAQPGSPFSQPGAVEPAPAAVPMTVLGEQVAARMKELFYSYDNRRSADNRSAQATLGPSEVGTPCDRRLALSLLRVPPVNPGGDGWAAFVGTCIHAGLAEMFMWADAGTGRFAVEQRLTFPSQHMPKGTADLLDRTLCMLDDHKAQGKWSQNKLRTEGIPPGYRVQLHTYGYGKRLQGEVVDYVALISWPREASSLDDLYVVVEPYDPQIARDALARVDGIAEAVATYQARNKYMGALDAARQFPVADDCRFCPFYAPGDAAMDRGCNGRQ